jgi:hypothetical protein
MKSGFKSTYRLVITMVAAAMFVTVLPTYAKDQATTVTTGVPVRMTVTASVDSDKRMPAIQKEDVFVRKGKDRLNVIDWTPARGDRAGLELYILIDDASTTSLGVQLEDLRNFINAQPATTSIGVAYARNATIQIVQDFTTDHARAARSLRLPMGSVGAYGSPYLSVVDLMKRWPESPNRHEVILVTDGIDRAHRGRNGLLNPDVDTAADVALRSGNVIHTIYFPGIGHWHRNFFESTWGQNAMARLSDLTGGESFSLGLGAPVSLSPYLGDLQKVLESQYLLTFAAKPDKKAGLQYVNVTTEVAGVDLNAADAVWVPAAK